MIFENVNIDIDDKLKLLYTQSEKISKEIEELKLIKNLKKKQEDNTKQKQKKIEELNLFDNQIIYTYQQVDINDLENSSSKITIIDDFTQEDYFNIENICDIKNFKKSKVKYKHGDILDTTQHRHYSWTFIDKNGKLESTKRITSLDQEYGVTAPIQITYKYEDALKKFSSIEEICVIEVSYYDKTLKNYEIPDDKNYIFEYRLDFENDNGWELFSIDKYNNEKICKLKINNTNEKINNIDFTNKTIVCTGKRDSKLIEILKKKSIIMGSSVTKNTSALITDDINSTSEKIKKAKNYNIPIFTIEQFLKFLED